MNWLEKLIKPEILELVPYSSARTEFDGSSLIQLDANESPKSPYGQGGFGISLNRYPEPQPKVLKKRLADLYNVDYNQILMTRGMDEAIDLLLRAFCIPYKDKIAITPPTYGYYEVAANINGIGLVKVLLDEENGFAPNLDGLSKVDVKIIILCTPNNPTGTLISLEFIKQLCDVQKGRALIAVDEAYIEFSDQESATTLLAECENLVVMRTLSKAYGLAGVRVGSLMARKEIIELLMRIIAPYPIPSPSIEIALNSLSPIGISYTEMQIREIREQREYLSEMLKKCPEIKYIYPSEANYLLLKVENVEDIYNKLKAKGIIIRKRDKDIVGAIRISIGNPEENQLILAALGVLKQSITPYAEITKIRKTKETEILLSIILDNKGIAKVSTGIGFFDHMLEQLSFHSGISLKIEAVGDINIDGHHMIEDVAIVLGQALRDAAKDKKGLNRYGFVLPMDEAEATVSIDLSGRPYCEFDADFKVSHVGTMPTEMVKHFFDSLSINMGASIHIRIKGENAHHMIESCFKAFAKALKQAMNRDGDILPSTKGVLE